ncbi:MAG TPA: hypothetical protein VJ742_12470 [Nitrososphaera sp.]|nr:hypothetical protein [Nitrososphaera sp.]
MTIDHINHNINLSLEGLFSPTACIDCGGMPDVWANDELCMQCWRMRAGLPLAQYCQTCGVGTNRTINHMCTDCFVGHVCMVYKYTVDMVGLPKGCMTYEQWHTAYRSGALAEVQAYHGVGEYTRD